MEITDHSGESLTNENVGNFGVTLHNWRGTDHSGESLATEILLAPLCIIGVGALSITWHAMLLTVQYNTGYVIQKK